MSDLETVLCGIVLAAGILLLFVGWAAYEDQYLNCEKEQPDAED